MSSYTIYASKQSYRLVEQGGVVRSCTIDLLEGLDFETARTILQRKGWKIVPDLDDPTNVFEFRGSTYELRWKDDAIVGIIKDDEEISWEELPEELKGLL